jgi:hypothetical protein
METQDLSEIVKVLAFSAGFKSHAGNLAGFKRGLAARLLAFERNIKKSQYVN